MEIIRRTNILIKTERKFIVQQSPSGEPIRCESCGGQLMAAQAAADLFGISSREIYRLIESEKIHFVETPINEMFVCSFSVKRVLEITQVKNRD